MQILRTTIASLACLSAGLLLPVHRCDAGLLNLSSSLNLNPWADITASFSKLTYDATTDNLVVAGTATAIDYDHSAPPDATIFSGGVGNPASFAINIQVDSTGALIGGSAGNDLQIMGRITGGPHPTPVYGELLTGEIVKFGYADSAPYRLFEFVFQVTGGSQAPYVGQQVGVIFDSISGFGGSFAANFATSSSGNADIFSIPEPTAIVLALAGLASVVAGRLRVSSHRRRR